MKTDLQLTVEEIRDRLIWLRNYQLMRSQQMDTEASKQYRIDYAAGIDAALDIVLEYCEYEIE